jgi:hypothetical protein
MRWPRILIAVLVIPVFFVFVTPCFAYNVLGDYGLGAGVMFPEIEGIDTDNSIYYLFDYQQMDFLFEVNYVNDGDMDAWLIHGDYLYGLTGVLQSEAYIGMGYSFMFADSDVLDDESGFNLCLGFNLQKNIDVRGRYLFIGGGDHILTAGATIYF